MGRYTKDRVVPSGTPRSNIAPNMRGGFLLGSVSRVVWPPSALVGGVLATVVVAIVGVGSPSAGAGGGKAATCGVCAAALARPASRANSPAPDEMRILFNAETEITLPLG